MCEEYNNSDIYIFKNLFDDNLCSELIRIYDAQNVNDNELSLSKEENRNTDYKIYQKIRELLYQFFKVNAYAEITSDAGYTIHKHKKTTILKKEDISDHEKYFNNLVNTGVVFVNLNDDNDISFVFPEQDVTIKVKKGSAILFPTFWTHPYKIIELPKSSYYLKTFLLENCCP